MTKISFIEKIKKTKSPIDLFFKITQRINSMLIFPNGGFTRYPIDIFMKKISHDIFSEMKVLDVGAGDKPYQKLFKGCSYESCDHEIISKETSTGKNTDHSFYCDITQKIPKPDNYYDLIICNEVLEHLNEPYLALKEFHRILRPEGKLVVTAPQCHGLHQEPYNYFNYLSYGLEYLFKKAKFTNIEITPLGGIFHLLGKVLNNSVGILLFRKSKIGKLLFYPIELLVKLILYLLSILLFYLDYFDKEKKWTIHYGCVCKK